MIIKLKEGQKVLDEKGNVYLIEKGDIVKESVSSDIIKIAKRELTFRYQMLSRFIEDTKYYLKTRSPKHLWSLDPIDHADNMLFLYDSFSKNEKPEWLTQKELDYYVKELYDSAK